MRRQPLPLADATTQSVLDRRLFLSLGFAALAGCASPLTRGQTPEAADLGDSERKKDLQLVGDYTRPWGLNFVRLESVALVKNLDNTGSDPAPSPQRQMLIQEMQSHEVRDPNAVLASPTTSLVLLRAYLPPGIQKGETFDVEVRLPAGSQTTSLHGGWLMESRLRQLEILGGQLRTGSVDALAIGDVLVDAVFDGTSDKINRVRGSVLAGGIASTSRDLGLVIRKDDATIRLSTLIGVAVNARFHTFEKGIKQGVATAKKDNYLDLNVPANYRNSLSHYLRVVRNIPLRENALQRLERMQGLERKLLEPATCAAAAIQLEAIGKEASDVLKKGLKSSDAEVRFHAAEALAYLDDPAAAEPLAKAAENQPAFRWYAFNALGAMDHVAAYNSLTNLLGANSAETRYGAFRAIRTRTPNDPNTRGEILGKSFRYHVIPTTGEPLVHFTRNKRPEVAIFGTEQKLSIKEALFAGKFIVLKSIGPDQIRISRFLPNQPDVQETCSNDLDHVVRTIVKVGGGYSDVIQAMQEAKRTGALAAKIAVEALPKPERQYFKDEEAEADKLPAKLPDSTDELASAKDVEPAAAGPTAGLIPVSNAAGKTAPVTSGNPLPEFGPQ